MGWEDDILDIPSVVETFSHSHYDSRDVCFLTYHPRDFRFTRNHFGRGIELFFQKKKHRIEHFILVEERPYGGLVHYHMAIKMAKPISMAALLSGFQKAGMHVDLEFDSPDYQVLLCHQYIYG